MSTGTEEARPPEENTLVMKDKSPLFTKCTFDEEALSFAPVSVLNDARTR